MNQLTIDLLGWFWDCACDYFDRVMLTHDSCCAVRRNIVNRTLDFTDIALTILKKGYSFHPLSFP